MQPAPSGVPGPGAGPAAPGGGGGAGPLASNMLLVVVMFGIVYFLMLRPQQKRQKEVDDMLKALQKGDKVRTTGGIRGEIVDLTDSEVTLLIADKVKINVLRSNIGLKIPKQTAEAKGKD